jgi:fatty acid-binding protein DegV
MSASVRIEVWDSLALLLAIKPVLHLGDGKLDVREEVRTQHRALRRMVELITRDLSGARSVRVAIPHAVREHCAGSVQPPHGLDGAWLDT